VQIAKIREDVDYYIASCCESDFEENEELYEELHLDEASAALGSRLAAMNHDNDDHSSDVSSEAPSIQNSTESVSPSPSIAAHSKVVYQLVDLFVRMTYNCFVPDYLVEPVPERLKAIWILLTQETVSGSDVSWAICKSAPGSRQHPTCQVFYRPDSSSAAQPTV